MKILDASTVSIEAAQAWAAKHGAHERYIRVAPLYWQIAPRYGIPPEIPYAQAAHETGWGKYTGVVSPEFHNWCGLKTKDGGDNDDPQAHQRFENDAQGVLAHIQHLARYAGLQRVPDGDVLVDPRWHLVTKFTDSVEGLGGAWAPAKSYGQTIARLATDLRSFANDGSWPVPSAQIAGFQWYPADHDHFERGRRERIRGGAQHYTAGTNSLQWLARTSSPEVSVHFLVRHEPTLDDRGWQLVRIEDTAWTTAFANPYTVAIEYEHKQGQAIPDAAYDVLAQTWVDIAAYVKAKGLGEIPLNRTGIRGHKEWVNNPGLICPDGIDVDRIVRRIQELTKPDPPADDWPNLPPGSTVPDPRKDNPFGTFWMPKQFAVYMAGLSLEVTGWVISEAFAWTNPAGETLVVQFTERQRYELHRDGSLTLGLVGRESLERIRP